MQRPITLAALTVLLTGTAIAQTTAPTMRRLPAPQQQSVVKPVTQIDAQKRVRPAPSFLSAAELGKVSPNLVGKIFSAPFTLSAAVRSVPFRGSVSFDNNPNIFVPNPLPPGSGGVATVFGRSPGTGPTAPVGAVKITIEATPNQLYAVDCVVTSDGSASGYLNYWLRGGAADGQGVTYLKGGHITFDVRGAATKQDISLYVYPSPYKSGTNGYGAAYEIGVMEFMGCQISAAS
jgi:hypothetical protein